MKKIFTLITMAVMAMTAMAEDYKGALNISLAGSESLEQEGTISVTETDGKYTLLLADFSFGKIPVGDIKIEGMENQSTEDGVVTLAYEGTVTLAIMPMPLPLSLEATIDKNNQLSAHISITNVPAVQTVEVDFVPPVLYKGNLAISLPGEDPVPMPAEITLLEVNDVYTLTLKDFSFGATLNFGDIEMAGIENTSTEEGVVALKYEGMITLDGPLGAMFKDMPISLDATIDKADVLNATILIKVPGVGDVSATFTSTESTGISSVETETEGSDEVVAIYDLQGRKVTNTNKKGIYILRKADGTTTKVYKK